jgi:hypothetical protein
MVKPPLRTKSVGTKVSDAEFAALEARAQTCNLTLSEWVRDVLLASPSTGEAGTGGHVLLGELLALRTILLNLVFSIAKGEPLTPEQMQALIERADTDKARRAMEKLVDAPLRVPSEAETVEEVES